VGDGLRRGQPAGTFLAAYRDNLGEAVEKVIEADPVAAGEGFMWYYSTHQWEILPPPAIPISLESSSLCAKRQDRPKGAAERLRTVPSKVGIGTPQNHAGGGRERSGLQALYFLSDDAVALAGGRFQTFVVENPDYARLVRDQTGGLEYAQGYGDSGPARTQHHRQELMAERNFVVIDAIACHEEPPCKPLLNRMPSVACRSLGYLDKQRLAVAKQTRRKDWASIDLLAQCRGGDGQGRAGDQNHLLDAARTSAKHDGQTDETFAAHDPYFNQGAVRHEPHKRHHASLRKVRIANRAACRWQDLSQRQINLLEVRA
jgi:hypothetical protein